MCSMQCSITDRKLIGAEGHRWGEIFIMEYSSHRSNSKGLYKKKLKFLPSNEQILRTPDTYENSICQQVIFKFNDLFDVIEFIDELHVF